MFFALLSVALLPPSDPVVLRDAQAAGVPVRIIETNLNDPRIRVGVVVAQAFPGGDEPFASMVKRTAPAAAVNGAYFAKDTLKPIGDIVIDGELVSSGRMGTALTFDAEGKPDIQRVVRHKTMRWEGFPTVLACGPALVLDGEVDVQFELEGFRDPHVTGRTQRMGVGYTAAGKLLFVHIRKAVSFREQATVMKSLGCLEAMNLDAGASLAMFHRGKTLASPGRKLTNILAVWVKK